MWNYFDDQEAKNKKIAGDKYNKKTIYFLNVKITIWRQIIERAKNPKMLDIFNEAFDEFLQAGWEYLGQDLIELQTKEAKEEYKMFKLLLSQIPDKTKKTRRGGKKHKKNKQAAEEEELDQLSSLRCIDCDDDVRTKTAFWSCQKCSLNTCCECCNNNNGYVLCSSCYEEEE